MTSYHLPSAVTTINDDIRTSGIGRSIRNQVDICALQLLGLTITTHRNHALPQILRLPVNEIAQPSIDITGRDRVNTGKVAPLVSQRARHVNAACLSDVVGGLFLGKVGDVSGHRGGDDEGSSSAFLEVVSDSLCAVEGTVQICLDDFIPLLNTSIQNTGVCGTTSICDECIDFAELPDHFCDQLGDAVVVSDVELVRLGFYAVLGGQFGSILLAAFGAGGVCDGYVGTHFGTAAGGFNPHASGTRGAGHDDDLAFQAEQLLEGVGFGDWDRHDCTGRIELD
jgi:hypothetical protein